MYDHFGKKPKNNAAVLVGLAQMLVMISMGYVIFASLFG
jgi:hypothetical protein